MPADRGGRADRADARALAEHERGMEVAPDDEHARYSAIVTLGALGAEVVRARAADLSWKHAPGDTIPFRLGRPGVAAEHHLPLFELAKRFVDSRDPTDAPSLLLGMMFGEITQIVI